MSIDQSEVIQFLSTPGSYGQCESVERMETHCSIVFITNDRAYKLKRAVSYSYLNYSTLALRRQACQREVTLNRRTAPTLYLGTSAIRRRSTGQLGFGGDGEVIDYVVVMARFDQENLFDRMAASGRLTTPLARDLADAILAFHANAEVRRDYGGARAIADTIRENDGNLRLASPPLDLKAISALHHRSQALLDKLRGRLDARRDAGKVRQCHGDLHLRNICLVDGKPILFDCIEFNDDFACIDVLYDLAFLLMDLCHRKHGELAAIVFNRYLDGSQDSEGLAALPLFLSLRAGIRSHVIAASASKQSSPAIASAQMEEAGHYLRLAHDFLAPATPRLIAIGGLSGSGKSTLAQGIAGDFRPAPGARVLRSDVLRKALIGVPPEHRLPASAYYPELRRKVYDALFQEVAATLEAGYTAIVDATFLDPVERRAVEILARPSGIDFLGLWLDASPESLRTRIANRRADASDANLAVLADQLRAETGSITWRRVDVSGDCASSLAAMRAALG